MKKLVALLAGLFISSVAFAGADITLGGDIEDVVIGNVWAVDVWVAEWRAADTAAGETNDVITRGGDPLNPLAVGAYFGSVNVTGTGIMVDDNGTPGDTSDDILFRGGDRYTTTTFYVGNNEEEEWKIAGTLTGSLLTLAPADGDPANSPVHGQNMLSFDGSNVTNVPANVVNAGVQFPVMDNVQFDVYVEATPNSMIGDTVTNMLFLNYLDIDTPAGTYNGTVSWVLTATV